MAQVSLNNVAKVYDGGVVAVEQIDLGIENKEFIVFVGPSGCGKSTTLRMIAGLEDVTRGDIYIGDRKVNNVPSKDRNIAMVFQNYALYPHMSVYENMSFSLRLRKYPKSEIEKRVKEASALLGIAHLLKRRPKELSGGERQRVAVGRAIVRKPLVFLFDEPLSNLDAKMRVQMRTEIHRLHLRLQTTMIYVTHDQVEAMTLGDRIAVMRNGRIQQFADPITVYQRPTNKFVAGFMGSPPMNFLQGKIVKEERKLYFDGESFRVKIQDEMIPGLQERVGKEITFGIRPENIFDRLFSSFASPDNTVRVRCEVLEPMGSSNHLHISTGKHIFVAVVDPQNRPPIGESLEVVFDMSKVHFFDTETEITVV